MMQHIVNVTQNVFSLKKLDHVVLLKNYKDT